MSQTRSNLSPVAAEPTAATRPRAKDPAFQAFLVLRSAFTLAPVLFGADKFLHLLVNSDRYLALWRLATVYDTGRLPWAHG